MFQSEGFLNLPWHSSCYGHSTSTKEQQQQKMSCKFFQVSTRSTSSKRDYFRRQQRSRLRFGWIFCIDGNRKSKLRRTLLPTLLSERRPRYRPLHSIPTIPRTLGDIGRRPIPSLYVRDVKRIGNDWRGSTCTLPNISSLVMVTNFCFLLIRLNVIWLSRSVLSQLCLEFTQTSQTLIPSQWPRSLTWLAFVI